MFIDCEKWRKEFKVDELYETFDYKVRARLCMSFLSSAKAETVLGL
jgi:hypothetical protein